MFKIYCAVNKVTGKKYVGVTSKSIDERLESHSKAKGRTALNGFPLTLKAYGLSNFYIYELESAESKGLAEITESYYIGKLKTYYPLGYNLAWGSCEASVSRASEFRFNNPDPIISECFKKYPGL